MKTHIVSFLVEGQKLKDSSITWNQKFSPKKYKKNIPTTKCEFYYFTQNIFSFQDKYERCNASK